MHRLLHLSLLTTLSIAGALAACSDPETGATHENSSADAGVIEGADAGADSGVAEPPVACGTALPGVRMNSNLIEAQPGYAAELEALDLSAVPDPFDFGDEDALIGGVVNFMLGRASGTTVSHEEALSLGTLGQAVLGAAAKGKSGALDFVFLRRGLQYGYPCSRPVPGSLAALKERYGDYETWEATSTLDCSRPKNGPRRLRDNHELGVYVAETLKDGVVRETEVLFKGLREDGQLDFAVYTPEGELTDRSTFATGAGSSVLGAPYTCMMCHVDADTGRFDVLMPTGTGAGCR